FFFSLTEFTFTSLSCGSPRGTTFKDRDTGISYISDTDFISTGVGSKIKSLYQTKTEEKHWYLRSFPIGFRNCYTFDLNSGERYLIRTTFLHGGYDNNSIRRFELHLGVNRWTTVSTVNETEEIVFEMIHLLTTDRLQVCLVKTGDSTPFISGLELRQLNSKAYNNTSTGYLQTFLRADVGSISNRPLRFYF
ncbi:probable LRR receptor-like serine/threonine-protein kinase At1g51860, partial [Arabidopsis lyrata subsp. lyrata]|uniref:probable LRR receptor-like serine/threonine-protein kinase At1g51860 n=1 Tax=Arabidopsis lyrata subsp. lyrata TaxID=81972 RepID=UPI000A29B584